MDETATTPQSAGPHEEYLTRALTLLREELPDRPMPYYRMLMIETISRELSLTPKEARKAVDDYLQRHGLGIRQPTPLQAVLFALAISVILVGPPLLLYWLWQVLSVRH